MISTAELAWQYSIEVERIRWALLDGRGELGVARHEPSRLMKKPVSEEGSLTSYSRMYFTGSSAWP